MWWSECADSHVIRSPCKLRLDCMLVGVSEGLGAVEIGPLGVGGLDKPTPALERGILQTRLKNCMQRDTHSCVKEGQ